MAIPKIHQQKIEHLLQKLWLNDSEILIYITWLQAWPSTVMQLAQQSWTKRVTAHAIIDSLLTQWVFHDTRRGKKRLVYPAPIDALQTLIEEKKFAIEQLESQLESSKSIFQQIKALSENFPNVRMLQWSEWLNTVLLEMARDKSDVLIMNDAHSFNKLIDEKTLHRSYQKRSEENIKTKMVFPHWFKDYRHIERDDQYDIHIKTLPSEQLIDWWIDIRWNKVALHCYKEWFVTTTILENKEIATILRCMYDAIWRQATDYQWSFVVL